MPPGSDHNRKMSNQNSTRIWENDSSASPPNSTPSRPAQLPSIATLTNTLPPGADNPASPAFSNNRSSDQWATPPQSTRKLDLFSGYGTTDRSDRIFGVLVWAEWLLSLLLDQLAPSSLQLEPIWSYVPSFRLLRQLTSISRIRSTST